MMPQDNMPHDDAAQDKGQTIDLIKQALMKVIDDMTALESDNHLPDGHPLKIKAVVAKSGDEASPDLDMSGTSEDTGADDSDDLDSLMGEAGKANDDGSMPEDNQDDMGLPPEVMDAVNKKKAAMGQ